MRQRSSPAYKSSRIGRIDTSIKLILCICLWISVFGNAPLWIEILRLPENQGASGWVFVLGFFLLVFFLNVGLMTLINWGRLLKPVLILLVLISGAAAYFMFSYGVIIDAGMIRNALQTDVAEVRDLTDWRFALVLLVFSFIPIYFILNEKIDKKHASYQVIRNALIAIFSVTAAICVLLAMFAPFSSTMRNHPKMRYLANPLSTVYSVVKVAFDPLAIKSGQLVPTGADARLAEDSSAGPLVVIVVGETARAESFQGNGYARPTTPNLSQRKDIFFAQNAWACGTSTAESLPCMFSALGREKFFSRSAEHENLLDVIHRTGMAVLWLDNQSGCKGVCDRVQSQMVRNDGNVQCTPQGECHDSVMLNGLEERIESLPEEKRRRGIVLIMHQMGSHGPAYFKRSAEVRKAFLPECGSIALQTCSKQEVVNAYDNSIVETDFFLSETIRWLEKYPKSRASAMIYVSDHGESLGEGNIYLHGLPYSLAPDVQKRIPWIVWLSPGMQQWGKVNIQCMQKTLERKRISHDNLFHSALGVLRIQTSAYTEGLDIFAACRTAI